MVFVNTLAKNFLSPNIMKKETIHNRNTDEAWEGDGLSAS